MIVAYISLALHEKFNGCCCILLLPGLKSSMGVIERKSAIIAVHSLVFHWHVLLVTSLVRTEQDKVRYTKGSC